MSLHLHLYVGPYIRVPRPMVEVVVNVQGCRQPGCRYEFNASSLFCPADGHPVVRYERTVLQLQPADVLPEEIEDTLYQVPVGVGSAEANDVHFYFIANVSRGDPRPFQFGRDEPADVETRINALQIGDELRWLRRAFAAELSALEKFSEVVDVLWGVLRWYA